MASASTTALAPGAATLQTQELNPIKRFTETHLEYD
jgi:hypothetical protein